MSIMHTVLLTYALVSVLGVPFVAALCGFNDRPSFRGSHESQFLNWRRRHPAEDVQ